MLLPLNQTAILSSSWGKFLNSSRQRNPLRISLLGAVLCILAINILLLATIFLKPGEVERTAAKIDFLKKVYANGLSEKMNTLIAGDSTVAFSVDPLLMGQRTFSMALPGSTMLIVNKELNRYLEKNPPPRCLLLSTSYIDYYYEYYFWQNYLGTNLFDWNDLKEIYDDSENKNIYPASDYSPWHFKIKSLAFRYFYLSPYKKMKLANALGITTVNAEHYNYTYNEIKEHRGFTSYKPGQSSEKFVSWRHEYLFKPFKPILTDDYYFGKILQKMKEQNIRVVYFEVPVAENNDPRVSDFHKKHLFHIQKLLSAYPDTRLLTFKKKYPMDYFRDLTHFNLKGAIAFSNDLKREVEAACPL